MQKATPISKPLLRGVSHQVMFFVSFIACGLLIAKCNNLEQLSVSIIYSVCVLLLFGISALYHRVNWQTKPRAIMRKLDHSAIYLMIAGTSTPICIVALGGESGRDLLVAVWVVAILGILQSTFFSNIPKFVSAIIYLFPGYMVAPYMGELMSQLGSFNIKLFFAGGALFTIGAICYALKRPTLNPKVFGYHEVFHLLVCLAAIFHFMIIFSIIK